MMTTVRGDLLSGTVTFLFTDVEGSTKLLHELGADRYAAALAEHRRIVREAFSAHGGVEVDTQGDAFFVAFPTAPGALRAAAEALEGLASGPIRVRVGVHTGTPHVAEEGYVGVDVHRAARIAACGHGGQVLVSAATASLAGTEGLRDLGEHRLKDFDEPVSLYQLGEGSFPPLKTISNTNLPRPASSFVGRDKEVAELASLLRDDTRLLTLTGPGGSGKTRLAIEAAAELVPELKAGVFWVGLATLRDPALVTETIAGTLGAKHGLAEHIGERELLLLLDNLEQVVEAAPELAALVEACPNLRLLVTSRELLRVRGEVEYSVLPLADQAAIELFCTRGRTEPDETVRELCRALDNLPLALELAAAHVKALTVEQILGRLDRSLDLLTSRARDAPERQRTLRATIEWSYALLSEDEQRLFARLAVFAGSFDLEAIETVCEAHLDLLASLVDKSLLRRTELGRFFMLGTIREFAQELFAALNDAERLRDRHAGHYLSVVERVKAEVRVVDASEAYAALDAEHDEIRRSLSFFEEGGAVEEEFRLIAGLAGFWFVRGHWAEGYRRVEEALRHANEASPRLQAEVLAIASDLARVVVGPDLATSYAEQSLSVAREIGDPEVLARALHELGESVQAQGDYVPAKALFREAIAAAHETGHTGAGSILNLGDGALMEGDFAEAVARSIEAAELFRAEGSVVGVMGAQFNLSSALFHLGRLDEARAPLGQALRAACDVGYSEAIAWCLLGTAAMLAKRGPVEDAGRLLGSAEAILDEIGSPLGASEQRLHDVVTATLDAEGMSLAEASRQLGRDDAVALAFQYLD